MNGKQRLGFIRDCTLTSGFIKARQDVILQNALPYQWSVINDQIEHVERSSAVKNFKIAAGLLKDTFYGRPFQDSDLYKWLEAVGYALMLQPNQELQQKADEMFALIEKVQCSDGYLYTPVIISGEPSKRYANLRDEHELYCAGHFMEAAVAYHTATGSRTAINTARKLADHLCRTFGPQPDQIPGYPGHPEIELALMRLYDLFPEERYLQLAAFFVRERGKHPLYFNIEAERRGEKPPFGPWNGKYENTYNQTDVPFFQQHEAVGHAVRALYLYCALTDIARETGDEALLAQCGDLWNDVTLRKMYITGGVGSSHHGEAITTAYDLPNDTAYAETCASVALALWADRMFLCEKNACYIDILERALYNTVSAGMSLDGLRYFYVNPLEVRPKAASGRKELRRLFVSRQPWFTSSCCPTNIARLLTQINRMVFFEDEDAIYVNLYTGSRASFLQGQTRIEMETRYPADGRVLLHVYSDGAKKKLRMRIPRWCSEYTLTVDGRPIVSEAVHGYVCAGEIQGEAEVELVLRMNIRCIFAPDIPYCAGKTAYMRGPLVYCAEEYDNGPALYQLVTDTNSRGQVQDEEEYEGLRVLSMNGFREQGTELYSNSVWRSKTEIRLIPYCLWGNRGTGEMTVWLR